MIFRLNFIINIHLIYSRAEQKSSEIYLEVGKKYYIEALLVENAGDGFISVAYKLPSGKQTQLMRSSSLRAKAD